MKLCIVCLLVALVCVSAVPLPEEKAAPKKGPSMGPMQRMFDMFTGMPKNMIKMADKMVGNIPYMNMFPKFMEGGLDVGEGFAKGMDKVMKIS